MNQAGGEAMSLSRTERWMLSNQYQILEKLYPEEAESYAEIREAIECGYEAHYELPSIYAETMSEEECREVWHILDMFRALHDSYKALADKSGIEKRKIEFAGFDGNSESRYLGYASYYCRHDGGRFSELRPVENSHMPCLDRYLAMLSRWEGIGAPRNGMSREHILHVAE
jgi:uncharacterized protein